MQKSNMPVLKHTSTSVRLNKEEALNEALFPATDSAGLSLQTQT